MSRNRHHRYGNTASNNVPGNRPQDHRPAQGKPRTIKPMALTIEQLDAFMSRDFTDVETKPFTHNE